VAFYASDVNTKQYFIQDQDPDQDFFYQNQNDRFLLTFMYFGDRDFFSQDQYQHRYFIFVLEAPRDEDLGLED